MQMTQLEREFRRVVQSGDTDALLTGFAAAVLQVVKDRETIRRMADMGRCVCGESEWQCVKCGRRASM